MSLTLYSPADTRAQLGSNNQVALVDVREQRQYGEGHALLAVNIPLARLESELPRLVPGKHVRLIFCDEKEELAKRAATIASQLGYMDVSIVQGGLVGWRAAGLRLFSGTHILGAALAESLDREFDIPKLTPEALAAWQRDGRAVVVLDSRPWPDYVEGHIPGAIDCPLGELAYRVGDLVENDNTPVVVNCAGRTRSILGAQTLLNTGLANPVYSLHQGTYGWWDAGYELARGKGPRADTISLAAMDQARVTAQAVAAHAGVVELDDPGLEKWQQQASRHSLYLLDVRWEHEYQEGHVPGAVCAPGGQLIECSEDWIGVRNGRILLLDDDGARARITASWLKQLGYPNVGVLHPETELAMTEAGIPAAPAPPDDPYYPEPETKLECMQGKKRYMDWQATLPDELRSDGLVSLQLLRV